MPAIDRAPDLPPTEAGALTDATAPTAGPAALGELLRAYDPPFTDPEEVAQARALLRRTGSGR